MEQLNLSQPNQPHSPDGPGTQTLTQPKTTTVEKTKLAPQYNVILHDDDKHTYQYVIVMLMQLFGKSPEKAYRHAKEVDSSGRTVVDTTTQERAELKRDQIKSYGADPLIPDSPGSMHASIEPVEME